MKVCTGCGEVVGNEAEICPDCKETEFEKLLVAPYNDSGPYLDDEETDR